MCSSNCCLLTCIQETGEVVLYSHLCKNFPQLVVIHRVKGFGIVNEAEVGFFPGIPCFLCDPMNIGNLIWFLCLVREYHVTMEAEIGAM